MTAATKTWLLPSLIALVIWGIWGFLPKVALQTLPPQSVLFYEALGNIIVTALIFLSLKEPLTRNKTVIQITCATGVISALAILAFLYALTHGPVSVIVTLTAMYPVITLLLARIFLKEKITPLQGIAVLLAVASIALLTL